MKEDKTCPHCGGKLNFFYLKTTCPHCGVNLLYYNMEERLEQDAQKAAQEVDALWRLVRKLDKAHLIEKHCRKKGKPLPWEARESAEAPEAVPEEGTE